MQLQQQYCSCSSTTILNQFTKYICIPSLVIENKSFSISLDLLPFQALYLEKVLQLQQQYCSCSSSTFLNQFRISNYPYITKFGDDKFLFNLLSLPALYREKVLQLQQQCCSCSNRALLNQFRLSNYPYIPSLVIIYELLPKLFNLEKVLQLQQQCCSCSSSTLWNQFRTSNYPCIPS